MNENVIAGTEQEVRKRDACTCWEWNFYQVT